VQDSVDLNVPSFK